ncbi:MAG: hypothetical protein AAGA11_14765 [Pseudomonadota bacterium]
MLTCNWRAVGVSVLLFAFPYALIVLSTGLIAHSEATHLAFAVVAYATPLVVVALIGVGYLAARFAGDSGVANGAASGLAVTAVLLIGPYVALNFDLVFSDYLRVYGPHALVMGVFCCSLGGLIRELITGFRTA